MRRRILRALAVLLGEPIPHDWTVCPNRPNQWTYTFPPVQVGTGDAEQFGKDWKTISTLHRFVN